MVQGLARAVVRHRGRSALLVLAVLAAAIAGALRIQIDFSSRAFYGAEDPAAAQLRTFHETFGPDDNTLAVVLTVSTGSVATGPRMEAVGALHDRLANLEGVRRVVALSTDKAAAPINLYGATQALINILSTPP